MLKNIDRIILYLIGYLLISLRIEKPFDITFILLGFIITCITYCFDKRSSNNFEKIIYVLLLIICLVIPECIAYISIVLYTIMYRYRKDKLYITITYMSSLLVMLIYYIEDVSKYFYSEWMFSIYLCIAVLSIIMGRKSNILEEYDKDKKKLRDDSQEIENLLLEKNKYLSMSLENEIHMATLSERNRIAREIHDNVGHIITRSILQLGAVMAINKNEKIYSQLIPLKDSLDSAMNNIRESVHDLHNDSFDINQAAKALLDELSEFEVDFKCDISLQADKEIKYAFITILREAITNILKYSNGDKVIVVISELEQYYQMLIEDNGNKTNINKSNGIGIINMEERIHSLGGIINISCGKGFRIFISVPKKEDLHEDSYN